MTYLQARKQVAALLAEAGIENEAAESGFLLEYVTGQNKSFYLLHQMDPMPEDVYTQYMEVTKKRCTHIPLQHITGCQEFMGLDFMVNEHVLIPRQDTETLVEAAIERLQNGKGSLSPKVLDLCTGSGCIAISIAHYCPQAELSAGDLSEKALEVARQNGQSNRIKVEWIQSDLFEKIPGVFDMIVSNPPYIPTDVIPTLMPEVRDHEPMSALDGTEDGLWFYRQIVSQSQEHLTPGGWLLFEIGFDQAEAVSEYMKQQGMDQIQVLQDPAGLDRVVLGRTKG